ncbi:hypothetical protein EXS65_01175 [Candidatus Peribacteria bacterium]|nr:hypothetical protein [Candidatus Peribacteria bacterium]
MLTDKPHLHSILGAGLVSSFAFIVGLLNMGATGQLMISAEWFVLIFLSLALSVFFLISSACLSDQKRESFCDKWAIRTFLLGFFLLIIVTVSSIMTFAKGNILLINDKLPYLFSGFTIGFFTNLFLKNIPFISKFLPHQPPQNHRSKGDNEKR